MPLNSPLLLLMRSRFEYQAREKGSSVQDVPAAHGRLLPTSQGISGPCLRTRTAHPENYPAKRKENRRQKVRPCANWPSSSRSRSPLSARHSNRHPSNFPARLPVRISSITLTDSNAFIAL